MSLDERVERGNISVIAHVENKRIRLVRVGFYLIEPITNLFDVDLVGQQRLPGLGQEILRVGQFIEVRPLFGGEAILLAKFLQRGELLAKLLRGSGFEFATHLVDQTSVLGLANQFEDSHSLDKIVTRKKEL